MAQEHEKSQPEETSPLEWAVAALGMMLVIGTVGYMIYYGITHPDSPPQITVSPTSTSVVPEGYLVEFTARNQGNSTAAGLLITGSLVDDGSVVEESEATLDYLPQQSERRGGLMFRENPSAYELRLEANGYEQP